MSNSDSSLQVQVVPHQRQRLATQQRRHLPVADSSSGKDKTANDVGIDRRNCIHDHSTRTVAHQYAGVRVIARITTQDGSVCMN
jgi:hypothetical protein